MTFFLLSTLIAQPELPARDEILREVHSIASPGVPGTVVPIGPRSFTLAYGREGKGQVPVAAGGHAGDGRVIVFGHGSYLASFQIKDTGRLLLNGVKWASRGRTALVVGQDGLADYLAAAGIKVQKMTEAPKLDPFRHCLVTGAEAISPALAEEIRSFLQAGGGLVTAATGWGWQQLNEDKPLSQLPANRALMQAGLLVTGGYAEPSGQGVMLPFRGPVTSLNAWHGLERIKTGRHDRVIEDASLTTYAAASLPFGPSPFRRKLDEAEKSATGSLRLPVTMERPLDRLVLALTSQRAKQAPIKEVRACPTASQFPGAVPKDALRESVTVSLPAGKAGWLSTGLYAAAGEEVKISLDQSGWTARVGAHSDGIWGHSKWERAPEISRTYPLTTGTATIASAYGGLIYLIPTRATTDGTTVRIHGAVRAPRFVRGQTTNDQWLKSRTEPGPWAEIEGDRIIHTVPSEWVRTLDDPGRVAEFWDKVTDACADLAQIPVERRTKERIVADVQISVGYMHAGYPIMTHLDTKKHVLDVDYLMKEGSWGHFHEIGHNHQSDDWTFEGTVEVTVNLFTLYVYDKVLGKRPEDRSFAGDYLTKNSSKFASENWSFDRWKEDPFMALTLYMQKQERFGWDQFKKVFAEYRKLDRSERPRDDQEKRDQWLVRFSLSAKTNLAPLFSHWRIPVSDSAVQKVKGLPAWK